MSNYSVLVKLIADDKEFKQGFSRAGVALNKHIDTVNNAGNSYAKTQKSLRLLTDVARNAAMQFGAGSKQFQVAAANVKDYRRELDKVDRVMRKNALTRQTQESSLANSVVGVAAKRIIPLIILNQAGRAFGNLAKTIEGFNVKMSTLEAVTGSSEKQMDMFAKSAIAVSSVTPKTTTEVADLQIEMAKLGLTSSQILAATESVVHMSVAGMVPLGEAAAIAASTMKSFSLEAEDITRISDVMAKSFTISAVNMAKFTTSMAIVSPAANAAGYSLEFATSALAVLIDRGMDASMAGTSLRNVMLKLSAEGLVFSDVMTEIATSTNQLATAQKYFETRTASAAVALANNNDVLIDFVDELYNAEGAAQEMSNTIQNNLTGDFKLLASAWEATVIRISEGSTKLGGALRALVTAATWAVAGMDKIFAGVGGRGEMMGAEMFEDLNKAIERNNERSKQGAQDRINLIIAEMRDTGKITKEGLAKIEAIREQSKEDKEALTKETYLNEIKEIEKAITNQEAIYNSLSERSKLQGIRSGTGEAAKTATNIIALNEELELIQFTLEAIAKAADETELSNLFAAFESKKSSGTAKAYKPFQGEELVLPDTDIKRLESFIKLQEQMLSNMGSDRYATEAANLEILRTSLERLKGVMTTFPEWDMSSLFGDDIARVAEMERVAMEWESFYNNMKQMALDFAVDMGAAGLSRIFERMATKDKASLDNYGLTVLQSFGDFLVQMGSMMIAYGVAQGALLASATTGNFVGLIVAGGAMVAIGAAMSGLAKGGMNNASGSGGGSDTGGAVSQQACPIMEGFSRYAADGMGSSSRSTGTSAGDNEVVFKIEGDSLVGVLNKSMKRQNSLY